MKILSMTATFGKLEHATLKLEPGLNIIHAPNEWGKSTWCAFLVNMLYGIDTRARTTGSVIADKERYAPWSGAAMSGRIELIWNGKNITIERSSKGRTPFGEFRAYETETGIDVQELTAANCGQTLLGVERSVFTRAGFLRLTDLPVTQDEALRRRLNSLVTTGDESGDGDKLGQTLKELKNKCRFNNTGLLPQAETEREQLKAQLHTLQSLNNQIQEITHRQAQILDELAALENHKVALHYQASVDSVQQVKAAEETAEQLSQDLAQVNAQCAQLPSRQQLQEKLEQASGLVTKKDALQLDWKLQAPLPQPPAKCAQDPQQAKQDLAQLEQLEAQSKKQAKSTPILAIAAGSLVLVAAIILAIVLQQVWLYIAGGIGMLLIAGLLFIIGSKKSKSLALQMDAIKEKHPGIAPTQWVEFALSANAQQEAYEKALAEYNAQKQALDQRREALETETQALVGEIGLAAYISQLREQISLHERSAILTEKLAQAKQHAEALRGVAKLEQAPEHPDSLTYTMEETVQQIAALTLEKQQLQLKLGQTMGRAEALGDEKLLRARLDTLNRRITRLEDTYHALELAQDALYQATLSLQRRFAPVIAKHTQDFMERLTDGKYQRLTIAEDMSLSISAQDEDTLHSAQWRSDGTVDQLYLALRLAVARELTPNAPLVLDDALVRFDDIRLQKAMEILKEESENKQVILFTCQGRETAFSK